MAKRFTFRPRPAVGPRAPAYKPRGLQKTRPISRGKNKRIIRAMRKGSTKAFARVRAFQKFKARTKGSAARFTARRNAERQAKQAATAAIKARRVASIERFRAKGIRLSRTAVLRRRLQSIKENRRAAKAAAQAAAASAAKSAARKALNARYSARIARARRGEGLGSSDNR